MLDGLAREFDLYVLSNKPHEAALQEVAGQGLEGVFREVWGGGRFPALKPDPAGVVEALRETGVGPERGAMVGDLPIDAATGLAAGVATFLVEWGFRGSAVDAIPPCEKVGTPERLAERLRRALTRPG
jgi:phosphoglycolate phosphatase